MIYKIIHNDFEIDLLDKEVDFTEQNQWFVDGAPINFTLPISMTLTRELDEVFNMISHLNSDARENTFDVKIFKMNKFYDAVMSIESIRDLDIEISFKYGFDEYPNFSKKLRQLPLEEKSVTSLRLEANSIKQSKWPQVNYKFPAVHVGDDAVENNSGRFDAFEGVLNLFESGVYVENTFDPATNEPVNRNIIQPFPYLLHVLEKGFEDAGFTLVGDILEDDKLKQVLIGSVSNYYINFSSDQEPIIFTTSDLNPFQDENGNLSSDPDVLIKKPLTSDLPDFIKYRIQSLFPQVYPPRYIIRSGYLSEEFPITEPGRYKLAGNLRQRLFPYSYSFMYIYLGDELLFDSFNEVGQNPASVFDSIELDLDIPDLLGTLKIFSLNTYTYTDDLERIESNIVDLTLTKVADYVNGEIKPSLNEANKVKLNETMPNKTFGELVKAVMAWRNLDIRPDLTTREVSMNRIDTAINLPVSQDLTSTEVKYPVREPNQQKSFLLKFDAARDNTDYKEVFFSRNGVQTENITQDENTVEINIGLLPLLNSTVKNINTASLIDKSDTDICILYHDGDSSQSNTTLAPNSLFLPSVFDEDHKSWLTFRLNSNTFKWTNIIPIEDALLLNVYKRSFAYNQNHLIKLLVIRLIDKDFAEADFETEA